MHKQKHAFTLAELLLALTVMSILMVAMAPVITKRVTDNIKVSAGGAQAQSDVYYYDNCLTKAGCTAASDGSRACDCTFSAPSSAKLLNVVMVGGGGGGAGATQPLMENKTERPANDTATSTVTKNITISSGMKNVKVSYLTGGGGGGGGGTWAETSNGPASQADCDKYDAKYLTAAQNNGKAVCVTKYNIGDIPSATNGGIASSVTTVSADRYCSANSCCWQGKTASGCDSSGTSYSGCNRTVCTWYAANDSCLALAYNGTKAGDWRLPTKYEMAKWSSNIDSINTNQGDNGLRLCDGDSGYGAARCLGNGDCDGSTNNFCIPAKVWSSTASGNYRYYYNLHRSIFVGPNSDYWRYAHSSRCVYEGSSATSSISGGGGSGAPYIKNYAIPDDVISANIGGKIVLSAGAGGTGGAAASSKGSSASNGGNGSESTIIVYNSSGSAVWGLRVLGGNGGKGATSTAGGAGGATKSASSSCYSLSGSSWVTTSCSGAGNAGASGSLVSNANETTVATGGTGGGSYYSGSYTSGGAGGSAGSVNGTGAFVYGAGSGGGTVGFDSSDNPLKGKGARGANGTAEITYQKATSAAAGGGGGGGAFAKIRDINVTPGNTYTIRVGGGGSAGGISAAGGNGGNSSINIGSITYTALGGKGGKAGVGTTHGLGGDGGSASTTAASKGDSELRNGKKGSDGQSATDGTINSWGGRGGESSTRVKGGCGGLYTNALFCSNANVNGLSVTFSKPEKIEETSEYGSAGAGGGGGGWSEDSATFPNPGTGGEGQSGYVYIYWTMN